MLRGYVSPDRPAPTGFPAPGSAANLLWVVIPDQTLDYVLGPLQWSADHGVALPAQGAECVVVIDQSEIATVEWWEGAHEEPPEIATLEAEIAALTGERGITEITWGGASPKSNVLTIPVTAGVGKRPFLTPFKSVVCTTFIPVVESLSETELKVFGFCPEGTPGAGKNKLAWWLA